MKTRTITPGIFLLLTDLVFVNFICLLSIKAALSINAHHNDYATYILFNNIAWLIAFYFSGNYTYHPAKFNKLIKFSIFSFLLFLMINWLIVSSGRSLVDLQFLLTNLGSFCVYLLLSRLFIVSTLKFLDKTELIRKNVVVIGTGSLSDKLIKQLQRDSLFYTLKGVFTDEPYLKSVNKHAQVIGNIDDCITFALDNNIHEIYTTITAEADNRINQLANIAESKFIRFKVAINQTLGNDNEKLVLLNLNPEPVAANIKGQLLKRFFDIFFSVFAIIFILSWLTPIIALLIVLDSPGPVFFRQKRTGIKNKTFSCIKFRSLHVNNDADDKQVTKGDTRYTRLGLFLRKSNIDELPQFINVLAGDMSVVGSRPHMLKHTELYSKLHNRYMRRHYIKPGLTGWAQINGYRGEIKMDEQLIKRVDHDLWYIDNWNLWLDIRIVYQTFSSSFKGDKNAY